MIFCKFFVTSANSWLLQILECGGNVFDAVSLAVKAALFNTRVPLVTAAIMDGGNVDLTLSDDPFASSALQIENVPILVTICKIGDQCVVDPSAEEELCSSASLVVGICRLDDKGKNILFNIKKTHFKILILISVAHNQHSYQRSRLISH